MFTVTIFDRFRNRDVAFFNNVTVDLKYDSIASTFQLEYLFDPNNKEHKEFSCVGHYHICFLKYNGELVLKGYNLSIGFFSSKKRKLAKIAGYTMCGVLGDCEIPTSAYPLQSDGLSLREIAAKYIKPFGIGMIVDSSVAKQMDEKYGESEAKETANVGSYLAQLASQKNIILTHTPEGNIRFTKASDNQEPLIEFTDQTFGVVDMEMSFNGQGMHSDITVMQQASIDDEEQSSENTVQNPFVPIVFRPKVATQSSGKGDDTLQAAKNILAQELKNFSVKVEMDTWTIKNKVIRPGKIVTIFNPEIYLYKKTKFMIEGVALAINNSTEKAVLNCVVPEVFTGKTPVYPFKGINNHA